MKRLFLLMLSLFTFSFATAQLNYVDGKLQYGNGATLIGETAYNTVWGGNNHYWINTYGSEEVWLKIDTGNQNVRIGGNGYQIVFRGPSSLLNQTSSSYNDIHIGTAYCYSDARAKTNIVDITNATERVKQIRPVSYEFKGAEKKNGRTTNKDIGFLAQELQDVVPEAVTTNAEGEMLVNYMAIIPILTGSIQELNARIEELEAELNSLKKNNK